MDKINAEVFMAAVEQGSFLGAGKKLGYTQAGISYIIAGMEENLGFPLFIRVHGGVRLTPEGEQLLPFIRQMEVCDRLFQEKVNDMRGLRSGKIRVLVFDSIAIHWIPGILKEYKRDFPGVEVELITMENSRLAEEMILRQEADCAFFMHWPVRSDIYVDLLLDEKMKAIVSPKHPLAAGGVFPVSRLDKEPFICMAFSEESGIMDIFRSRGLEPKVAYRLDNDYAAMAMVAEGHGFCIFPETLLRDAPYALAYLDFDEPIGRRVSISTHSLERCSAAAKKFMEYARKWVTQNEKNVMLNKLQP